MHIDDFDPSADFWGKLAPRDEPPADWHPLEHHCLDVAACARRLLAVDGIRRRLAHLAGLDDLDLAQVDRLVVLTALHDLGKFNHGFQERITGAPGRGHTREITHLLGTDVPERDALLEAIDYVDLVDWFEGEAQLLGMLWASISHHGQPAPPLSASLDDSVGGLWRLEADGRAPLAGIVSLAERLKQLLPRAFQPAAPIAAGPALQHAFAGLVMLSDWLGSDTSFFPYTASRTEDRWQRATDAADQAIAQVGLEGATSQDAARRGDLSFSGLFGMPRPRPMQEAVGELPVPSSEGSLLVLEAETGSGKTEAAWWWFARLLAEGRVEGLYFAVPTRAAATQLHQRLTVCRDALGGGADLPGVILAVPGYLRVDDVSGKPLPGFRVLWDDDRSAHLHARHWAAESSKRYLAAGIAVGTIDQVLMSTLKLKHAHMRAFCLQRSLLVVDEVHASDAFMGRLLEEVLRHHLAAGGHALLMSATLGATLRDRLEGLVSGPVSTSLGEALATAYPRVSLLPVAAAAAVHRSHDGPGAVDKVVQLTSEHAAPAVDALAEAALSAARDGARVLVIRNTVGECVDLQERVEALAGHDVELLFACSGLPCPHHSRFSPADRRLLDAEVEARFGKRAPPKGQLLVATQTVEQSLDIDADVLFTDLCPVDVLLQRIGRLHRHVREDRPAGYRSAVCHVLVPEQPLSDWIGTYGPHGWGTVYRDLRVLAATLQLVHEGTWRIPTDNRRLVEQGTHPESLDQVCQGEAWESHRRHELATALSERRLAKGQIIPRDQPFATGDLPPFPRRSEERIQTRLGEDDRVFELPNPLTSPFGTPLRELRLPAHLARDLPEDAAARVRSTRPIEIAIDNVAFEYGPHGLRRLDS